MTRGWYFRFALVVICAVLGVLSVWPSVSHWFAAPAWVSQYFEGRIVPGLDIRGGLRLVYEAEVDEAIADLRNTRADQLVELIGRRLKMIPEGKTPTLEQISKVRKRVTIRRVGTDQPRIQLTFNQSGDINEFDRKLVQQLGDMRVAKRENSTVILEVREDRLEALREDAVKQAKRTIVNRIDELQLRQTSVSTKDTDIIIEVPGEDEETFKRTKDIISRTARLDFKIVDDETDFVAQLTDIPEGIEKQSESVTAGAGKQTTPTYLLAKGKDGRQKLTRYLSQLHQENRIPDDHQLLMGSQELLDPEPGQDKELWRTYYLFSRSEIGGDLIEDAWVTQGSRPEDPPFFVSVDFKKPRGAELFEELTGRNVKRRMAIVLDDRVESAPVIQTEIGGGRAQITLGYGPNIQDEAKNLSIVLKAGALPVPIRPANEQLIGPTLGADAVQKGAIGGLVGIALVLLFMLIYYEIGGLVANVMVVMNLILLMAFLAVFSATLTLPGIAGIALTVGMAVDANVLIMERIREELRAGKSPRAAVDQGYSRAFWSIMDAQLTTLIAGIVLYQFGTGPIRGFAVTLMAGIVTSLFSSVFCSRVMFDWLVRGLRLQRLRVG